MVSGEIVGHPEPAPLWKRVLGRAAAGLILGSFGLLLAVIGAVLTLSILGAAIGIPLFILGVVLMLAAALLALGRGRFHVVGR